MESTLKRDSEAMQRAEVAPSERLHQLHLNMLKAVDTLKLDRKKDDLDFNKKFAGQLAHLASEKTRLKDFKQEWKEYMEEMDPELRGYPEILSKLEEKLMKKSNKNLDKATNRMGKRIARLTKSQNKFVNGQYKVADDRVSADEEVVDDSIGVAEKEAMTVQDDLERGMGSV